MASLTATNILSIREHLMEYFKGSCVEKLINGSDVHMAYLGGGRQQFQYQREAYAREYHCRLVVNGRPLLDVRRHPEQITFHNNKKNAELIRAVQMFLREYLPYVEVTNRRPTAEAAVPSYQDGYVTMRPDIQWIPASGLYGTNVVTTSSSLTDEQMRATIETLRSNGHAPF